MIVVKRGHILFFVGNPNEIHIVCTKRNGKVI